MRSTSPFSVRVPVRGVTWFDPRLVAEVTYSDVTPAGVLRAPVFRGFATTTSPSVLTQSG
jgi:ATP-dependent DNA ligase